MLIFKIMQKNYIDEKLEDNNLTKIQEESPAQEIPYRSSDLAHRSSSLGTKIRKLILSLGIGSIVLIGGYSLKKEIAQVLFGDYGPTQFEEIINYKFEHKGTVYSGKVRREGIIKTDDGEKFKILGDAAWPLDNSGKIPYRQQTFRTPKNSDNLESRVEQLERRVEQATSELTTIRESDRSESYKRGEIARVQRTYGQDIMLSAMRKVPLYDEESGRFVTMDTWVRDFTSDLTSLSGINQDTPFTRDPVGQAFDLLMGNKDPVQFAMENYIDPLSSSSGNESQSEYIKARVPTYVEPRVDTYDPIKEAEKRSARKAVQRQEEERQRNNERSIEERREMREQVQRDMERTTERARETAESARESARSAGESASKSISDGISEIEGWFSSEK